MIPWFDPPALDLGPVTVDVPTSLAIAGAVAVVAVAGCRARKAALSARRVVDGALLVLLCAWVFGHVVDVLVYRSHELRGDWTLILPWRDGTCSLGAGLGLAVAVLVWFRAPGGGLRWRELDQVAVALLVGLALLRVGCFLGHHHAGRLSGFALAVAYPGGARHDLGLYEAALAFVLVALLAVVERRGGRAGTLSAVAMLGYGIGRFGLEVLRPEDLESIGRHSDARTLGLTVVQYGAVVLVAIGGALLRRGRPLTPPSP